MAQDLLKSLSFIEQKLHYVFKDQALLRAALQHPVLHKKNKDFERLEFLGDRVLGLALAEALYKAYPREEEGALAVRLAYLGSAKTLRTVLQEGKVVEGLRAHYPAAVFSSIPLEDVGESLLGALYLDGGLSAASATITLLWHTELQNSCAAQKDSKSTLQEFLQERKRGKPIYTELSRTGPDHHPMFQVRVTSPLDEKSALGMGSAKRSAEQAAAAALLQLLQQEESYGAKI